MRPLRSLLLNRRKRVLRSPLRSLRASFRMRSSNGLSTEFSKESCLRSLLMNYLKYSKESCQASFNDLTKESSNESSIELSKESCTETSKESSIVSL